MTTLSTTLIVIIALMIIGASKSKKKKNTKCQSCIDGECQCAKKEKQNCGITCECKH